MNYKVYLLKPKFQLITTIVVTAIISLGFHVIDTNELHGIHVTNENSIDIGLLLVQINSITVGLLIAFYFFKIQNIESQKTTYFLEFKKSTQELIHFKVNLPNNLLELDKPISKILNLVTSTDDRDFPYGSDEWKTLQSNTKKIISKSKNADPIQGRFVLNILADIEFFASKIGLMIVSGWLSDFLRDSIKKQILLIIGVLIMLIFLSLGIIQNNLILLGLNVFFVILTINSLLELLFFILDYSKNLNESSKQKS